MRYFIYNSRASAYCLLIDGLRATGPVPRPDLRAPPRFTRALRERGCSFGGESDAVYFFVYSNDGMFNTMSHYLVTGVWVYM